MTETGCKQCGENTFSEDGASSCTKCPDGKMSSVGSTSLDDCRISKYYGFVIVNFYRVLERAQDSCLICVIYRIVIDFILFYLVIKDVFVNLKLKKNLVRDVSGGNAGLRGLVRREF